MGWLHAAFRDDKAYLNRLWPACATTVAALSLLAPALMKDLVNFQAAVSGCDEHMLRK